MKPIKVKHTYFSKDGILIPLSKELVPGHEKKPNHIERLDEISRELTKKINAKLTKKAANKNS